MYTAPLAAAALARKATSILLSTIGFSVFLFFDFLEVVFCVIYRFLDEFFEGKTCSCYCEKSNDGDPIELSETLYRRNNVFRQLGVLGFATKFQSYRKASSNMKLVNASRWSECGCVSCVSYTSADNLYVVLNQPSRAMKEECSENVIFLHGFLSSSSFWTETVFPNLSEHAKSKYRLFAVDLLGFGRSPKPRDCFYTLKDHSDMIEKSVINPYQLKSFHVVAHSMGYIIALALAAKYSNAVKSVTLIAPPYFSGSEEKASVKVLEKLAGKKLWPLLSFGSAFMSWYEHLGRCVCLVICRNHKLWESIIKLLTWRREVHFMMMDITRHTHHSAWHTMHNVICGGAKLMDECLETLTKSKVKIYVMQGDRDNVVPLECSNNIEGKASNAQVCIIPNADHTSVIIGREKDFTHYLEHVWDDSFPQIN